MDNMAQHSMVWSGMSSSVRHGMAQPHLPQVQEEALHYHPSGARAEHSDPNVCHQPWGSFSKPHAWLHLGRLCLYHLIAGPSIQLPPQASRSACFLTQPTLRQEAKSLLSREQVAHEGRSFVLCLREGQPGHSNPAVAWSCTYTGMFRPRPGPIHTQESLAQAACSAHPGTEEALGCPALGCQSTHSILGRTQLPAGWKQGGTLMGSLASSTLSYRLQRAFRKSEICNARAYSCFGLVLGQLCQLFLWL